MAEKKKNVEVLAPAGSYDIMKAVLAAGADAVYLGGSLFGARAFAGNFNQDELRSALDYAHLRGKKIYMTVNTLLKEPELFGRLVDYMAPFYEAGLDAAIVQDFGVFQTLHQNFPDLPLHASTQMTVTGSGGASLLKKMGAARVVTARELNLPEIRAIHKRCDIEIESFVHGALCYCYSGQCLLSSMNGGRSGNRGRCAQPCRLDYTVQDAAGHTVNDARTRYALSPKDLCALKILPDIIEAGVHSLKIEGRMKNVTYAAGVTAIYRKYVDLYQAKGRDGYAVSKQDIQDLMDIYNRGAFTEGYYRQDKGRKMMSLFRPNHMGTAALEVQENIKGRVTFKALTQIYPQDVFEIDAQHSFSSGGEYREGMSFEVNLPQKHCLPRGRVLYRMRNQSIVERVQSYYANETAQTDERQRIPAALFLEAKAGQPLRLKMSVLPKRHPALKDWPAFCVEVTGAEVQPARKQRAEKEKTAAQLSKLGNTLFIAKQIEVSLTGAVFLPVSQLNEIRRASVSELTEQILKSFRRPLPAGFDRQAEIKINPATAEKKDFAPRRSLLVMTRQQAESAARMKNIDCIYYDFTLFAEKYDIMGAKRTLYPAQKVAVLPHIIREQTRGQCGDLIRAAGAAGVDAFLVRNLEEIGLLAEIASDETYKGTTKIIADAGLYCWNSAAVAQLVQLASGAGLELIRVTLPYELTASELAAIDTGNIPKELIVQAPIPLMLSEQCLKRTYGQCDRMGGMMMLTDRKNTVYSVKSVCSYCYSILYSPELLDITNQKTLLAKANPDYIRVELTEENADCNTVCVSKSCTAEGYSGHFITGVE